MNRILLLALVICALITPSHAQQTVFQPTTVSQAVYFDITPPLRDMKVIQPIKKGTELNEIPNKIGKKAFNNLISNGFDLQEDPVWQKMNGPDAALSVGPIQNFEGVNNISGVYPPDTQGDVGLDSYVQVVNLNFGIFSKTGSMIYGPAALSTIWTGIPDPWNGTNNGDPVVLFDQAANRWIITQFSLPTGNYAELVAISQTSDPTGPWYRYVFQFFNEMPDYPKFGIWPDAYYLSVNQFTGGSYWGGVGACALDRAKMIAGDPTAGMVYFNLGSSSDPGSMLPADWDGTVTPLPNEPNYFTYFNDWSSATQDFLKIWEFHVDWATPANSTFSLASSLETEPFKSDLCGAYRGRCIPQPGTSVQLESLSDRLMYRLQYRNFGGYRAMVTNHTVDVDNSGHAGVRWYELRNSGSGWSIYQQGTYAPDADHRWMGSIAMNASGFIALGYSISNSSTMYPSIRYTGRKPSDPLGQMTIAEQTIINGSGSQTGSAARWGDYSMMSVDPSDDATFWYTTEYIQNTGGANWQTRVASFKFSNDPTVTTLPATAVTNTSATLNGTVNPNGLPTDYHFEWGTTPAYGNSTAVVSAGSGTLPIAAFAGISGLTPGLTHHYRLTAVNSDGTVNGNDLSFIPGAAVVTTGAVSEITTTTATCGGNVLQEGGSAVAARGVCWSAFPGPTILDNHTADGSGAGSFISWITGLSANSTYFVRAYATNSVGTFYGQEIQIQTLCDILTLPFTEIFESTLIPNCWTQVDHQGNGQIWQFGTLTGFNINPALTGNYAYLNSDAYGSGNTQNADLVSPLLDLSGYLLVNLEFKHYFYSNVGSSGKLSYSIDNGNTWTLIQQFSSSFSNPDLFSQDIPSLAGQSQVKLKWNYTGTWGFYWAIDDILITAPVVPPLMVTPDHRTVNPMSDTTTFRVLTLEPWTATSDQPWCAVTPSGSGIDTATVICLANALASSRTANISFAIAGNPPVNVTVTQSGLLPPTQLTATVSSNNVHLEWNEPNTFWDAPGDSPGNLPLANIKPVAETTSDAGVSTILPVVTSLSAGLDATANILYDNGPLVNSPGTGFGGADESVLFSPLGTYGFGAQQVSGNSMAEDFIVSPGGGWDPSKFTFFAYQTGTTTTSTVTGLFLRIYNGDPTAGGTIIWGDLTTNRMTATSWSNIYRTLAVGGATDRGIMKVEATVTGLHLSPGTYWVEWQFTGSASYSGPWAPPVTITGTYTTGNAKQNVAGTWGNAMDGSYQQGMPFIIEGGGGGQTVPGLIGYNIYRDGTLLHYNNHPNQTAYNDEDLPTGTYNYLVSAIYDLTGYGFPGQFGESEPDGPVQAIVTDTVTIGNGTLPCYYPYATYWGTARTQMLYKASELTAEGANAGLISSIGFDVNSNSNQYMEGFNVKLGATGSTSLDSFADGLTTCYNTPYAVPGTGWKYINLTTPFYWDGNSNVIVEICFANTNGSTYSPVSGSLVPGGIIGHFQDNNPDECSQTMFNTTAATPRPNIRFEVSSLMVSPSEREVDPSPGTTTFAINTNTTWTSTSDQPWCTVTPSGTGSGMLTANFTLNDSEIARTAIITVTIGGANQFEVMLIQSALVPPTNLQAANQAGTVQLSWNAPVGAKGLTGYNVYRYGVLLNPGPIQQTTYEDAGLAPGSYSYVVKAVYGAYESAPAGPVLVETNYYVIGTGTATSGWPYYTYYWSSRTQMLYTSSELSAAGVVAGQLQTIGFNVATAATQTMNNFAIKLGSTTATSITGWVAGLSNYYSAPYTVPGTGWRDIVLTTPFVWDGTSNVIVEICFANSFYTTNSLVYGTPMTGMNYHFHADNSLGCSHTTASTGNSPRPNIRFSILSGTYVPPMNLQGNAIGANAHLTWDAPSPATDLLGYFVYRNGVQLTPVPISTQSFDDIGLANGTYQYSVKATYPTGMSLPAGPVQVIISILPAPIDLIAGSGFKYRIPLNWKAPASDQMASMTNMLGVEAATGGSKLPGVVDYYKVYRKTGASGIYALIGNTIGYASFNPTSCYVDQDVNPGTAYYYKVTAVTGGSESSYSNEAMATCNSVGFSKNIPASPITPVLDGIINAAEWADASKFLISNTLGVFNPSPDQPVSVYYKRVGNLLYLAAKDLSDVSNDNDELGIYFDNNSNMIFDQTDGNLWIDRMTDGSVSIRYRQITGAYPYSVTFVSTISNPAGIAAAIGFNGGHREYEVSIDLVNSVIKPVNNAIKNYLFTWNQATGYYNGFWPDGNVWPSPDTYAELHFLNTPLGGPATTAATVSLNAPGLVNIPVTVTDFNDITALSLRLEYKPSVLTFTGVSNILPQLNGLEANNSQVSASLNKIMISWSDPTPRTILPGEKMFDLAFNYIGDSTSLVWNNSSNGGSDCEYADAIGNPLPDLPTANYYINGFAGYLVPTELNLNNIIIVNGQDTCFNALQTINVAGNGTTFTVQGGGSATLIAGQKIRFLPGAKVQLNGYLHGYIGQYGESCFEQYHILPAQTGIPENEGMFNGSSLFRVYPNPTSGEFMVEIASERQLKNSLIRVFNLMGNEIMRKEITNNFRKTDFSLDKQPSGIYIITITGDGLMESARIVKQ